MVQIEVVLPIAIAFAALCFTALSFRRTETHDTNAMATERANLTADVRYIRSSIDEIKLENRAIRNDLDELKTKVVEIEQSTKSAHKRLDDLRKDD